MNDRLRTLEDEFVSLESSLSDPAVVGDQTRLRDVSRRYKDLTPVVECIRRLRARRADAEAARELLTMADDSERSLLKDEAAAAERDIEAIEEELRLLMLPKDPNDGRPVIMEIRGAEGGEEANLFARDLYDMYRAYANAKGWSMDVLSEDRSDLGGLNQITLEIRGDTAWGHLKFEGGPHRVQRVPVTESQGRIHTSSATVLVLPEAEEVEVDIDPNDLEVDVYRSSGAGGQSVNTTDSAVRITHKPTGLVVTMQDERSQIQNRARAMTVLRSRLLKLAQDERDAAASVERRAQVGGGGRGEKIRTYNFKENRLTDHRIGFTIYRLADVLAGDLDEVVEALAADERTRQLAGQE
ncbi:MAG: peptide chain release factor 1 [Ilumatobacteraceae bacterium]